MTAQPLILTARMDKMAFSYFDALRRRHFPPERNHLEAHITLFHKLPGGELDEVELQLQDLCKSQVRMDAVACAVRFLGQGVAIDVTSEELCKLRSAIAGMFLEKLSLQDRQSFRPHITIQNKADAVAARTLHTQLAATFTPFPFHITGVTLWRYRGGPWDLELDIDF